ncbi:hypothetical protein BVRB_3g052730 isoform B [Beta vulgaris subsp. vulgaris]|nr:hypothetical protein BVRB_3g052730 isoform B [Beta vulgaris subsp. vulgaris]
MKLRYLKNGPSNLEKYMERRFGYALSGEDIENAVLGGPQEMNTVIIQWYRNTKRHVLLIR